MAISASPEVELEQESDAPLGVEEGQESESERRARQLGWHPQDEYRGPPGKWRSAEEFLRIGETEVPVMRNNLRVMGNKLDAVEKRNAELLSKVEEQSEVMKDLLKMAKTSGDQAYKRALEELKTQQREAVTNGDIASYDALENKITTAEQARAASETSRPVSQEDASVHPKPVTPPPPNAAVSAFLERNSAWWNRDAQMTNYATSQDAALRADPDWSDVGDDERLEEVERIVKEKFPARFGAEPRQPAAASARTVPRAAAVGQPRGGSQPPRQRSADPFEAIEAPAERADAKRAFERMKRQMPDMTPAEYMEIYANPHADVLTSMSARKKA